MDVQGKEGQLIKNFQDDSAERRLLYVAITRARKKLILSDVVSMWLGTLKKDPKNRVVEAPVVEEIPF